MSQDLRHFLQNLQNVTTIYLSASVLEDIILLLFVNNNCYFIDAEY